MFKRSWRGLFLLFVTLALLSRNITGAPNVQMSFASFSESHALTSITEEIESNSSDQSDHTKPAQIGPKVEKSTSLLGFVEAPYKSYKKYVAPERILPSSVEFENTETPYETIQFNQSWAFSSLPREIHAQDPPVTEMNTIHIGATQLKGVGNFGGLNTYQRDWGFGLYGLRTP